MSLRTVPVVTTFIPALHGGGAERVVVNLLASFVESGFDTRLLLLEPHISAPHGKQYSIPEGVEVRTLKSSLRLCLPELALHLRREAPDVLLSHLTQANVIVGLARQLSGRRFAHVLVEHNMSSTCDGGTLYDRLLVRLMQLTHPRADAVVAVSHAVARDLAAVLGVEQSRVLTIFNPLVSPSLVELAQQRAGHPWLDGDELVVLGIGRLVPGKNWQYLVRSFALLKRREPRARLVILGTGPEEALIRNECHRCGLADSVDLPGFVVNPYAFLKRARVVALTSHVEGLPSVLVEALASETPVVATASSGGVAEAIGGGRFGVLAPFDDEEAFADALYEAIRTGAHPLAAAWVRSRFGVTEVAQRYEALIRSLA